MNALQPKNTRRAMTLMELLVVILVITVLASLLVPIVTRVRDQATRTKCMNHCRQLMNAVMLYTGRYESYLPFSNWRSQEVGGAMYVGQRGWLYWDGAPTPPSATPSPAQITAIEKYLGHRDIAYTKSFSDPNFAKTGGIYPFLNTLEPYHCPLDQAPWPAGTTRNLTSYQMNGAVSSYGNTQIPCSHKITAFRTDAAILWECHESVSADPGAWNDGANGSTQGPPTRHGSGGSVAFIDGHIEWISQKEFSLEISRIPNRFNCDPLRPGL